MLEHADRFRRSNSRAKKILKQHLAQKEQCAPKDGAKMSATAGSKVSLDLAKAKTKLAEASLLS